MLTALPGSSASSSAGPRCGKGMYRPELMQMLLASDPHSPPEYRVNGVVPNIPAFYEAFKIQPGDKLYLDPAKRVKIW